MPLVPLATEESRALNMISFFIFSPICSLTHTRIIGIEKKYALKLLLLINSSRTLSQTKCTLHVYWPPFWLPLGSQGEGASCQSPCVIPFFYKHVNGQLAPSWVTVKFLDQRRSLGAPVSDFTFFHRRGHKTLPEMQNFSCRKDSNGPSNVRGDTSRCQGRWHLHGLIPFVCSLFVNMFFGNVSTLQPHMEFVTRVTSRARVKYFCLKGLALKRWVFRLFWICHCYCLCICVCIWVCQLLINVQYYEFSE